MSQQELLTKVIRAIDVLGIQYMLTGSLASSLQGEPRSTHDIDLVVELELSHIPEFLKQFDSPDYYLSESAMRDAVQHGKMFNLLNLTEGEKVDFWILTSDEFDRQRFARRIRDEVDGVPVFVSSPEDTILAKLRWSALSGGSEKQFTDALRVYELQFGTLDLDYLQKWAQQLGVADMLQKLIEQAEIVEPE